MDADVTAEDLELFNHLNELEQNGSLKCNGQTRMELSPNTIDQLFSFDNDTPEPELDEKGKYLRVLRTKFGHDEFKNKQWEIIRSIIEEKRDNCVVMATGYGKSLCFQFPPVYTNGITLVVSPLISLMQDQILSLQGQNISACLLGSAQTDVDIKEKVLAGQYRIVYACPEHLEGGNGRDLLIKLKDKLTLITIDEAHCLSQWGHDFRPAFRRLGNIRDIIPNIPILACTATANEDVRQDIINIMKLQSPQVIFTGADRSNLEFFVYRKTRNAWADLKPHLTAMEGSTIIYVLKKVEAESLADLLCKHGIVAAFYHSEVKLESKQKVLEQFKADELKVIVATIAFGMGIDKRDVRCVIHYGASKNMETYYQEVGRAGRDNRPSKVITIFDPDDFLTHDYFLKCQQDKLTAHIIQYQRRLAEKIREYLFSSQCRRLLILKYFDDPFVPAPRPNCCDNCTEGSSRQRLSEIYERLDDDGKFDFTFDAKIVMDAIETMSNEEMRDIIDFVLGISTTNAKKYNYSPYFGNGRFKQRAYWETMVYQLINHGFVDVAEGKKSENRIVSMPAGIEWSHTNPLPTLILKAIGQMFQFFTKKSETKSIPTPSTSNKCGESSRYPRPYEAVQTEADFTNKVIRILLSDMRCELAAINQCALYDICLDNSLEQIAAKKPRNMDEFRASRINGFDEEKTRKFAPSFVNGIAKLRDDQLNMDTILNAFPMENLSDRSFNVRNQKYQILEEIRACKSLSDIAMHLDINEIEVRQQMINYMRHGWTASKVYLKSLCDITDDKFNRIKSLMSDRDFIDCSGIARIKLQCQSNEDISDGDIALVLNYFQVRKYLDGLKKAYIDRDANAVSGAKYLIVEPRAERVVRDEPYLPSPPRARQVNLQPFLDIMFPELRYEQFDAFGIGDEIDWDSDNDGSNSNESGEDIDESVEGESDGSESDGSESDGSESDGNESVESESDSSTQGSKSKRRRIIAIESYTDSETDDE